MDILQSARKWALDNARKHNGSAQMGSIVSKLIGEFPDIRQSMKEYSPKIKKIVDSVNLLSVEEQTEQLKEIAPELLEKKVEAPKTLRSLKDTDNFVVRIAPSPSGPLHIGHAFVLSLNYEYAKMYEGKLIVRIDDTNPDNIYPPAYDLIPADANWLTSNFVSEVKCQSDRMESYYKHMEELIRRGHAYVCIQDPEEVRELLKNKQSPNCRNLLPDEHLKRWKLMFSEYNPGDAVVRIKTDVSDPNPALRDWPAFRINDSVHAKQGNKYRVWPLMNFAVAIDDHELGVTHTIRGMDHVDNAKRQKQICEFFGWSSPIDEYFGIINFEGLELSCTKTKEKIDQGIFSGWDDIRLPFLLALRRRGYQPESFIKFAVEMGLNKSGKTVPATDFFKMLNSFNRDIIEPTSKRFFFVSDPVKIKIKNAPDKVCELRSHPDFDLGVRSLSSSTNFYLCQKDLDSMKNSEIYRLMDCINFRKDNGEYVFDSEDFEKYKESGKGIFHWLPLDVLDVEVLMPDDTLCKGFGEKDISKLKVGDIVQFERFGFVRLDSIEDNTYRFWYAHN